LRADCSPYSMPVESGLQSVQYAGWEQTAVRTVCRLRADCSPYSMPVESGLQSVHYAGWERTAVRTVCLLGADCSPYSMPGESGLQSVQYACWERTAVRTVCLLRADSILNARHPDVLLMTTKTYKYRQNTSDLLHSTTSGLHVSTP